MGNLNSDASAIVFLLVATLVLLAAPFSVNEITGRATTDGDQDNDGILDSADNCQDVINPSQANLDKDSKGDACDPDGDGDGMADSWEKRNGLNVHKNDAADDPDGDGVNNLEESKQQTNPYLPEPKSPLRKVLGFIGGIVSFFDIQEIISDPIGISMIAAVAVFIVAVGFLFFKMKHQKKKVTPVPIIPPLISPGKRTKQFVKEEHVKEFRREQKQIVRETMFSPFDEKKEVSPVLKELQKISGFGSETERKKAVDSLSDLAENPNRVLKR